MPEIAGAGTPTRARAFFGELEGCIGCYGFADGAGLEQRCAGDGFFRFFIHHAIAFEPGYFAVVDHGNAYARPVVVFHARFDGPGRISLEVDGMDQPGFYFLMLSSGDSVFGAGVQYCNAIARRSIIFFMGNLFIWLGRQEMISFIFLRIANIVNLVTDSLALHQILLTVFNSVVRVPTKHVDFKFLGFVKTRTMG